jgi:transcriptional regulator with XRE-family HTH domain
MLIRIKGEKLKELRGERDLAEIVAASGGAFTEGALSYWENNHRQPKMESVVALLRVYGCKLEDIAEPMELVV